LHPLLNARAMMKGLKSEQNQALWKELKIIFNKSLQG
jgi:hypothetical protein